MSPPDRLPEFFLDRSLGRVKVPGLLRDAGLHLRTLAEHYGTPNDEEVGDVTWLELAGGQGWPVLMKDERIRMNPVERAAVQEFKVQAFCLTRQDLPSDEMARRLVDQMPRIIEACQLDDGPFIYAVQKNRLDRLSLDFEVDGSA